MRGLRDFCFMYSTLERILKKITSMAPWFGLALLPIFCRYHKQESAWHIERRKTKREKERECYLSGKRDGATCKVRYAGVSFNTLHTAVWLFSELCKFLLFCNEKTKNPLGRGFRRTLILTWSVRLIFWEAGMSIQIGEFCFCLFWLIYISARRILRAHAFRDDLQKIPPKIHNVEIKQLESAAPYALHSTHRGR